MRPSEGGEAEPEAAGRREGARRWREVGGGEGAVVLDGEDGSEGGAAAVTRWW